MPRVIGIDPGTVSIDLCGLEDGHVFLDASLPTREALEDPAALVALLEARAPLDLIVGPSGYGLPLTRARDLTEADYTLAFLAARGESGGIGGLRSLVRALAASTLPVMLTPGVIHLLSVPDYRKVNRIDMGTADKVCATALAVRERAVRTGAGERDVSFVLLELGGAFTAAIAVRNGQIVDSIAGSAGPLGAQAAGALDGEVAFLAGTISKDIVFGGGAAAVAGLPDGDPIRLFGEESSAAQIAFHAYVEGAVKAVAAVAVSLTYGASPGDAPCDVILSGRLSVLSQIRERLERRLVPVMRGGTLHLLDGFATTAKHAAQGAALLADGLAGGASAALVETMGIRDARGTVLDHLHVISPEAARARLGITG